MNGSVQANFRFGINSRMNCVLHELHLFLILKPLGIISKTLGLICEWIGLFFFLLTMTTKIRFNDSFFLFFLAALSSIIWPSRKHEKRIVTPEVLVFAQYCQNVFFLNSCQNVSSVSLIKIISDHKPEKNHFWCCWCCNIRCLGVFQMLSISLIISKWKLSNLQLLVRSKTRSVKTWKIVQAHVLRRLLINLLLQATFVDLRGTFSWSVDFQKIDFGNHHIFIHSRGGCLFKDSQLRSDVVWIQSEHFCAYNWGPPPLKRK